MAKMEPKNKSLGVIMIEKLKDLAELKETDSFVISISLEREGSIETQCLTNNFKIGNLPIAAIEAKKNIENIYQEHHTKAELSSSAT